MPENNQTDELRGVLRLLLNHVDFLHGEVSPHRRIGDALPVEVLRRAREVLKKAA